MKQLMISIAMFMMLASCKKDKQSSEPTSGVLKAITYPASPGFFKFDYDNSGRLIKVSGDWGNAIYEYSNGGLIYKEFYHNQATPSYIITAILNADATIKSANYSDISPNNTINGTLAFNYDANGYLVKKTDESVADGKQEWIYTWTNGNVSKIEEFKNGSPTNTFYEDYYADKLNTTNINSWFMRTYYNKGLIGKINKNLSKQELSKNSINVINSYYSFTYDLDANGNILKTTSKNMVTNVDYVSNFQYQ